MGKHIRYVDYTTNALIETNLLVCSFNIWEFSHSCSPQQNRSFHFTHWHNMLNFCKTPEMGEICILTIRYQWIPIYTYHRLKTIVVWMMMMVLRWCYVRKLEDVRYNKVGTIVNTKPTRIVVTYTRRLIGMYTAIQASRLIKICNSSSLEWWLLGAIASSWRRFDLTFDGICVHRGPFIYCTYCI